MSKRVALVGSGNVFFKDEGVGLYGAKYIKENYAFTPEIEIIDGGILGYELMSLLVECEAVIIINTASDADKKSGTISIKTADEFLDASTLKKTVNEAEIAEMLQICSFADSMAQIMFISIVPEDIVSVSVGLSEAVRGEWGSFIRAILAQIESLAISVKKKEKQLSLDEVVSIFANPSVEFERGF